MTTTQRSKTIEQKKAQAQALHNTISDQVEQLRTTDRWAAFLNFARAFHAYSLNNLLLILSQRPDATRVAGFRTWQQLGRQVRTGEKAIRIFGYSTKKITDEDQDGEEVERLVARYPVLAVFDITQTDPIDGAPDASTLTAQLTGSNDHGILDTLTNYLRENGWTIQRRPLPGSQNGYTDPDEMVIVLDANLNGEHRAKTLIHETAHVLLGHTADPAGYVQHRGLMETEAESVAFIVAGMAGFDTSAYSIGYIAGWSNADTTLIRSAAARVLHTAHQITDILDAVTAHPNPECLG